MAALEIASQVAGVATVPCMQANVQYRQSDTQMRMLNEMRSHVSKRWSYGVCRRRCSARLSLDKCFVSRLGSEHSAMFYGLVAGGEGDDVCR